jgi:hypothetical protein
MRGALFVVGVMAAGLLAGCGGSDDRSATTVQRILGAMNRIVDDHAF